MAKEPGQRYQTALAMANAARSATTAPMTAPPPPPAEQPTLERANLFVGGEDPTVKLEAPAGPRAPWYRRRLVKVGAVQAVVVLALVAGGLLWVGRDKPTAGAQEIFLEPATALGQNPFTPSAVLPQPPAKLPDSPVSAGTDAAVGPGSGGEVRAVHGDQPELYGGTRGSSPCDTGMMANSLGQNPDRGQAWASTFNITSGQIPAFLSELTPVLLRTDTRVTSHGFTNGQATPYQAVLEAGTAVLVNEFGVPVVRCGGGNPLMEPVAMASATYTNPRWKGFALGALVVIRPSSRPVDSFILADPTNGDTLVRPLGGNGSTDGPDPRIPPTSTLPSPPLETQPKGPPLPPPMTRVQEFPTFTPPPISTYVPPITESPRATTTKVPRETNSAPRTSYYKPPTTTFPRQRDRSFDGGSTGTATQKPPVQGSTAPPPSAPSPKPPPKPL
jgi:hypothetical protein